MNNAADIFTEGKKQYGPYDYVYKEYTGIGHGLPDVVVVVNDTEKFNGPVSYSLSAIIETIEDKMDPEMYFTSQITL